MELIKVTDLLEMLEERERSLLLLALSEAIQLGRNFLLFRTSEGIEVVLRLNPYTEDVYGIYLLSHLEKEGKDLRFLGLLQQDGVHYIYEYIGKEVRTLLANLTSYQVLSGAIEDFLTTMVQSD
jgi:hypothetical protein